MLPTEKRKVVGDLSQEIILAYGSPKIGKSTFFSYFPDALFISTEPGLNHLEVYEQPIAEWMQFVETVRDLEKSPTQFKTVIIDTIDNLYLFCQSYIYKINGIKHESDMEWGRGWKEVDSEFRRVVTRLAKIRTMGLCFVSHSEEKEIRTRGKKEPETKVAHTLPNRARKIINPIADMILYMGLDDNGGRVIHTKETNRYEAGDRTGNLPDTLPLNYERFVAAYHGSDGSEGQNSEAKQKLIDQIQVGLEHLATKKIDNFNTPQRATNSMEKHLKVKRLSDADFGALQSFLQHLRSKVRTNKGDTE